MEFLPSGLAPPEALSQALYDTDLGLSPLALQMLVLRMVLGVHLKHVLIWPVMILILFRLPFYLLFS